MKILTLLVVLCLAVAGQSIHVHPSGTKLVFKMGTNDFTIDRKQCLGRIRRFESEASGLREQLEQAQKMCREYPSRISTIETELDTLRSHLKMMDILGVKNEPAAPIEPPPSPPELPLSPGTMSGVPMRHVHSKE